MAVCFQQECSKQRRRAGNPLDASGSSPGAASVVASAVVDEVLGLADDGCGSLGCGRGHMARRSRA